jgi:hypothetical protein
LARRKRQASTFNLSFLDIMSCGFGAVVLVFLIIDHSLDEQIDAVNSSSLSEISLLEEDIREGELNKVAIKNSLEIQDLEIKAANGTARRIRDKLNKYKSMIADIEESGESDTATITELSNEIRKIEKEIRQLEETDAKRGSLNPRDFLGDGSRQYLTGLNLGGNQVIILLDASASMLGESVYDIFLTRNSPPEDQRQAPKWVRAVRTVEWLLANLVPASTFQLILFNGSASTLIQNKSNAWIDADDRESINVIIERLQKEIPSGGSSLHAAIDMINQLKPSTPDNIILITDGLPTQGASPPSAGVKKVTTEERKRYLAQAQGMLERSIPINIFLLPLEGDPFAETGYWKWAQSTGGSFMAPARNWP